MEHKAIQFQDITYTEELVLKSLGLNKNQLGAHTAIQPLYAGKAYLMVQVKNRRILGALDPDLKMLDKISKTLDLLGVYVFADKGRIDGDRITAKLFQRGCGNGKEMVAATLISPEEQQAAVARQLSLA